MRYYEASKEELKAQVEAEKTLSLENWVEHNYYCKGRNQEFKILVQAGADLVCDPQILGEFAMDEFNYSYSDALDVVRAVISYLKYNYCAHAYQRNFWRAVGEPLTEEEKEELYELANS